MCAGRKPRLCCISCPLESSPVLDEVTIEAWATFPSAISTNANLFAFGNADLYRQGGELILLFAPYQWFDHDGNLWTG